MKAWIEKWNGYWFELRPLHGLALFRFFAGILMFLYYLDRFPYAAELYSTESFLAPRDIFVALRLPVFSPAGAEAVVLMALVSALCFAAGLATPFFHLTLLGSSFYLESLEGHFTPGFMCLLLIALFLMLFAPVGKFGSADYMIWRAGKGKKAKRREFEARKTAPVWIQRLIVFQLAAVYFSCAFYKTFYAGDWFTGENLKNYFMSAKTGQMPFGLWLSDQAWLLPAAGTLTVLLQFFIGLFFLLPPYRYLGVALGFLFHFLTLFTFKITWLFAFTMFAFYVLVIPPEDVKRFFERALKKASRMKWSGAAVRCEKS